MRPRAYTKSYGRGSSLAGAIGGRLAWSCRSDPLRGGHFRPFAPQRDEGRHHCWAEKQSEKADRLEASEKPKQHPEKRQPRGAADQHGSDEMTGHEHDNAAADHDDHSADSVANLKRVHPGTRLE